LTLFVPTVFVTCGRRSSSLFHFAHRCSPPILFRHPAFVTVAVTPTVLPLPYHSTYRCFIHLRLFLDCTLLFVRYNFARTFRYHALFLTRFYRCSILLFTTVLPIPFRCHLFLPHFRHHFYIPDHLFSPPDYRSATISLFYHRWVLILCCYLFLLEPLTTLPFDYSPYLRHLFMTILRSFYFSTDVLERLRCSFVLRRFATACDTTFTYTV